MLRGIEGVTTPFVLYRDLYAGQCVEGGSGYRLPSPVVSEASAPGDTQGPIDLKQFALDTSLGTHILDFQFPQGDLIDMVGRRAAALP